MGNLRVLVTRPEGQQDQLVEVLAQADIDSRCLPMLALSALSHPADKRRINNQLARLTHQQLAIFISSNAVRFTANHLATLSVAWPAQLPCLAIGASTAKAIEIQAWPQVYDRHNGDRQQSSTSEGLLEKTALQSITGQNIMIFRGRGGRELLAEELIARGATVNYCELYQRSQPEYDGSILTEYLGLADGGQPVAAILFASGETLSNFCQQIEREKLSKDVFNVAVVVPSQRIFEQAKAAGFGRVYLAENASAESFLAALKASIV